MYEIRYGLVESLLLSDYVIVYNPKYGTPIGPYGSRPVEPPTEKKKRLRDFYESLEASVLMEGFRNPIFCNSIEKGTFCRYGTSRLWIAKKHKLDIPAVIADFDGRWEHLEKLENEEQVLEKFSETPQILEIHDEWMRIDACRV